MRLTVVLNPENKYNNKLYLGNRLLLSGTTGLEEVRLETKGKKSIVVLSLTEFDLFVEDKACVENKLNPAVNQ